LFDGKKRSPLSRAALFARDRFCNSLTWLDPDFARCEESPWFGPKYARVSEQTTPALLGKVGPLVFDDETRATGGPGRHRMAAAGPREGGRLSGFGAGTSSSVSRISSRVFEPKSCLVTR
jgi:hypothetical protein